MGRYTYVSHYGHLVVETALTIKSVHISGGCPLNKGLEFLTTLLLLFVCEFFFLASKYLVTVCDIFYIATSLEFCFTWKNLYYWFFFLLEEIERFESLAPI